MFDGTEFVKFELHVFHESKEVCVAITASEEPGEQIRILVEGLNINFDAGRAEFVLELVLQILFNGGVVSGDQVAELGQVLVTLKHVLETL